MKLNRSGFFAPTLMVTLMIPCLAQAQTPRVAITVPVTVIVRNANTGGVANGVATLNPNFLGLSYESSTLLPQAGRYYFDTDDRALVNTFRTLCRVVFKSGLLCAIKSGQLKYSAMEQDDGF